MSFDPVKAPPAPDGAPPPAVPPVCPRCRQEVAPGAESCPSCGNLLGARPPVPRWNIVRRIYDWTLGWAYKPSAGRALFVLSFCESSFFPVPPDVLLMPLVLGNRKRWLRYATLCSVASMLGALLGFLIGYAAWEAVDEVFFKYVPGFSPAAFERVSRLFETYNFWIVFTAGFTPIPYKLITISAGVFSKGVSNLPLFLTVFVVASIVSRSGRFFLVAGLMRLFGPKVTPFIEKYFNLLALVFTALLIGGFVAVKYVF